MRLLVVTDCVFVPNSSLLTLNLLPLLLLPGPNHTHTQEGFMPLPCDFAFPHSKGRVHFPPNWYWVWSGIRHDLANRICAKWEYASSKPGITRHCMFHCPHILLLSSPWEEQVPKKRRDTWNNLQLGGKPRLVQLIHTHVIENKRIVSSHWVWGFFIMQYYCGKC